MRDYMLISNMVPSRAIFEGPFWPCTLFHRSLHWNTILCPKRKALFPHSRPVWIGGLSSWNQLFIGSLWCQSPLPWDQLLFSEVKVGAEGLSFEGYGPSERVKGHWVLRNRELLKALRAGQEAGKEGVRQSQLPQDMGNRGQKLPQEQGVQDKSNYSLLSLRFVNLDTFLLKESLPLCPFYFLTSVITSFLFHLKTQ